MQLLDAIAAANGPPTTVLSEGTITAVSGAELVDGETFSFAGITFEFDDDASVVETATLFAVVFDAGDTDDEVATAIAAAIDGASIGYGAAALAHVVTITADEAGSQFDAEITETVVDATFAVTDIAGGVGHEDIGQSLKSDTWQRWDTGSLKVVSVAGDGALEVLVKVHAYSRETTLWSHIGTLNAAAVITGTDVISYSEPIFYLQHFDRIHIELDDIAGANSPAFDVFLGAPR